MQQLPQEAKAQFELSELSFCFRGGRLRPLHLTVRTWASLTCNAVASNPSLREHLLATQTSPAPATATSSSPPDDSLNSVAVASASSPDQNIDPAIGGGAYPMSAGESVGEDGGGESRKGRRELSTSKRAAQNRAAQRAFRQRKEEYIKKLKLEVDDYKAHAERMQSIQQENYQLRAYIIILQSRLLESQGEYPQPPASISLPHPSSVESLSTGASASAAPMGSSAVTQLQAAAAQAAAAHELNSTREHAQQEGAYAPASEYPAKRLKADEGAVPVARMGEGTSTA